MYGWTHEPASSRSLGVATMESWQASARGGLVVVTVVGTGAGPASPGATLGSSRCAGTQWPHRQGWRAWRWRRGFNGKAWLIEDGRVRPRAGGRLKGPRRGNPTGHSRAVQGPETSARRQRTRGKHSAMPYSVLFTRSGGASNGGGDVGERTAGGHPVANEEARYSSKTQNVCERVEGSNGPRITSPSPSGARADAVAAWLLGL